MTITAADLVWRQSERMTDTGDGGGQMVATVIEPGGENQIFDDLSDVDRAAGDVSIRQVYAHVASAAADKYLDACAAVLEAPSDPNVSVLIFSLGDYYAERAALVNRIQSGISRGALWLGFLWGNHQAGQRALTLWQRVETAIPSSGQRLDITAWSGTTELRSQVVWVTRQTNEVITRTDPAGIFSVRAVYCEIAEPLNARFDGTEPSRFDPVNPATRLYKTVYNADAVALVGVKPLAQAANLGTDTVRISGGLYSPVIPTAFAETAIPDANPGGDFRSVTPAASGTLTWTTTLDAIGPTESLFIGGPVYPGTLTIRIGSVSITDLGGLLYYNGVDIGSITYSSGICVWNDNCASYGTSSKTVTYRPAAAPMRVADTAAQYVTVMNRGFVWTITLSPLPAPGTLRVSYRVNDEWYELFDTGSGALSGSSSAYGSGTINFTTGTVVITTGELPDPESQILYVWTTQIQTTARGGAPVDPVCFTGRTANKGVAPTTFQVSWSNVLVTDDGSGGLSGTGGSGGIRYASGEWWIRPAVVPPVGTELTIRYDYGDPVIETFEGPLRNQDNTITLELNSTPRPGSLELEWPLEIQDIGDQWGTETEVIPPPYVPPAMTAEAEALVIEPEGVTHENEDYVSYESESSSSWKPTHYTGMTTWW
jgi:hypothetical protein